MGQKSGRQLTGSRLMNLFAKGFRKLQRMGHLPFNVHAKDRPRWVEAELLFQTDTQSPEVQWIYHPDYQDRSELAFDKGTMTFSVKANTNDEWAYIYLDPHKYQWKNYSWRTKFRRLTAFQEYAFNFRYIDFDNRYRYRFEDDLLFFDSKIRGRWRAHARMPFPMVLGAWYDLRIDVRDNFFRCYVNNMLMMENRESSIKTGTIAIILWEIDRATEALAEVGPCTVRRLA
jgi:hypothetical protein